ncbi:hypothetical protein QTO34_017130 [Cnephaeus nilssonii]|uniref:SPIN-DOC-like zinc-finger domain-containing protein n=1 Tax=Cnephaeus nilssonii TaxID=3371016 RepID=A0AA40LQW8_CNENI|nr:hypothetical protein QTO34_017130 [Eptesicus nilssonii]
MQEKESYINRHPEERNKHGVDKETGPIGKKRRNHMEKEVNKMEASNMSEKEFRAMVIRTLKRTEDKCNNICKNQEEMKKNQEEMKNDIAAIKNTIESINSRLKETEDHISELEDKVHTFTSPNRQLPLPPLALPSWIWLPHQELSAQRWNSVGTQTKVGLALLLMCCGLELEYVWLIFVILPVPHSLQGRLQMGNRPNKLSIILSSVTVPLMENPKNKKLRLSKGSGSSSGRPFQETWTEMYGFIEKNGTSFCILCNETVVSRTWNINRHFETNHSQLLEKSEDEKKEYISRQLHLYKSQSNSILKFMKGSTNLTSASLSIAHSIAQHGKALSEGEFIKETLLRCAPVLFHGMQNKDAIIKRISELPLSRNIIKD